jgi:hypothetical protein
MMAAALLLAVTKDSADSAPVGATLLEDTLHAPSRAV